MIDLSTDYVGLKLKNPLVPSASPLTRDLDGALRLEDAGAAAVVMYPLFEEELQAEDEQAMHLLMDGDLGHGEATSFLPEPAHYRSGLDAYLKQLALLRRRLEIPVVASLNGTSLSGWVQLGRELRRAGADALELNAYHIAADPLVSGQSIEARCISLLAELRAQVEIPIVMKLSPYFSSLPHFIRDLEVAGARGVALFNRFYQPDIDLEHRRILRQLHLSHPDEALLRIRWLAILHGRVALTLAAAGGVHSHREGLKMLSAGADVVHLASALLLHGPAHLRVILEHMCQWLDEHEFSSVSQLKGGMSQQNLPSPTAL